MRLTLASLLAGSFLIALAPSAFARPAHKKALGDYLGHFLAPKLNDCRTCHVPDAGKTDLDASEKPHNPFGARLREVRKELRKAEKTADVAAALQAVTDEDSDGDGAPNLVELLTGHNPGEKDDKPSDAEIAGSRKTLVEFARTQSGYPWRPFEKVRRPAVPQLKNTGWVRNEIDAFVAEEHEKRGLKPRPEAPKAVLLRRVYLDLIGLPPSREELHAFLADTSEKAYEKVVDKLLSSPRHGERWGRHWMDVWRYSDWAGWTGGGQIRDSQPHIWRWRDWIIESLNADKGYDRMILEMLAADEIAPDDPDALRATGYLVRNYKMLSREKWMQDTVDHTSMAFLGVTMGCARCHDHMYDPITQREYYQMRAIFEPHQVRIDRLPGERDTKKDGLVRTYDANPTVPTYLFVRGDDRTPDKSAAIPPGVPQSLGGTFAVAEPVKLPASAQVPDRRPFVLAEEKAAAEAAVARAVVERGVSIARGRIDPVGELTHALALARRDTLLCVLEVEDLEFAGKKGSAEWTERATKAQAAQRHLAVLDATAQLIAAHTAMVQVKPGANATAQQKKVADTQALLRKATEALKAPATTVYTPRPIQRYPETSTGRRTALARWIASPENPLTARVAMNHVWLRHFGQPLVPRVFDFGRNGRPPSHPALLDWLSAEFAERKWSMKAMHRLIVTSSTYRMDSTPDEANQTVDRDNVYLWRMTPRRIEAEVVRDCVYHVASKLDLTMGGPDIDYTLGLTVPRRSLYFRHAAEKQMEFLKLFDAASVTECYQRKDSVLPQQALALANSDLTRQHGRLLARSLAAKVGADADKFIPAAFEQVLSRPPTADEKAECVAFLRMQEERYAASKPEATPNDAEGKQPSSDPKMRARENLVHVLLNHHDFVTVR